MSKRRASSRVVSLGTTWAAATKSDVVPDRPGKLPEGPPRSLAQEEALDVLWSAKEMFLADEGGKLRRDAGGKLVSNPNWCCAFVYATLAREVEFRQWNGVHPVDENSEVYRRPAGTRVLVTMVSRFGDVGIRDRDLVPPSNGYSARVMPEDLVDWGTHP
jgi:hypothetical protein